MVVASSCGHHSVSRLEPNHLDLGEAARINLDRHHTRKQEHILRSSPSIVGAQHARRIDSAFDAPARHFARRRDAPAETRFGYLDLRLPVLIHQRMLCVLSTAHPPAPLTRNPRSHEGGAHVSASPISPACAITSSSTSAPLCASHAVVHDESEGTSAAEVHSKQDVFHFLSLSFFVLFSAPFHL